MARSLMHALFPKALGSVSALSVLLGVGMIAMTSNTAPEAKAIERKADVETFKLFVGPERVDCVGVAPQKCYEVRYAPDQDYQFFYSDIKGFDYEPGYDYELLVQKTPVENPPADASAFEWTLIEVVSKTPATPSPSRAEVCAIVTTMPNASDTDELLTLLRTDRAEIITDLEAMSSNMQQYNDEGYGWQNVMDSPGALAPQPGSWLIGALTMACEN